MLTSLSLNSISLDLTLFTLTLLILFLEFQAGFPGCFCQKLDPSMIQISITIKNYGADAGRDGLFSDEFTNELGLFQVRYLLACKIFRHGRCGNQGPARQIVDQLNIDVLIASENTHPRPVRSPIDDLANTFLDPEPSEFFIAFKCHSIIVLTNNS